MMNSRAITIAIAPAVCRTIEPTPYAISATIVTNSAVPMIAVSTVDGLMTSVPKKVAVHGPGPLQVMFALAGIVTVWNSEALIPLDE